jgi:UDP-N-acetylmuramoyl-L-alanyl-D-glutamate--2,6-diaminopimelate ligase
MKQLKDILIGVRHAKIVGDVSREITDLQFDSRKVTAGSVFIAVSGTQNDGHTFILKALELGAKTIVCERLPEHMHPEVCWVVVPNSAEALGIMASNYYDNPSHKLNLVGITGTNGKTTTVTLLYHLFRALGYKSGLISTVVYCVDDKKYDSTHTTPDQLALN